LRASADYIQKLNAELLSADCVIVAWCEKSIESAWVMAECIKAHRRGNLLPIKIADVHDDLIPVPFNSIHTCELVGWDGNVDDARWLTLKDDIADLIRRRTDFKKVEVSEEEDAEAMSNELYENVAVGTGNIAVGGSDAGAAELMAAKSYIQELVDKNGGSVPHASVAHALMTKWPGRAGRFNWFGYRRFAQLFKALQFRDLALDTAGSGSIYRLQAQVGTPQGKATANVVVLQTPAAPAPQAAAEDASLAKFAESVFESTGAPYLPASTYQALIRAIAAAIQGGASTLSEISRQARDTMASTSAPVGRVRANFVTKGALIGGLNLEHKPMRPAMVAMFYANSLIALCKANGLELSSLEQDRLLELIGFGEL
jgi:hypothetical protein